MPELLERLSLWLSSKEGKKIFRYSMVSVISTAVSFTVLVIVYGFIFKHSEVQDTVFANLVATFPSYWLNRSWAWGKTGRSHLTKEVLPFWGMSIVGIAISIVGATFAKGIGNHLGPHHHLEQTILVVGANILSFGIFWVVKLMVFNRLFHVPGLLEEIEEHVDEGAREPTGDVGPR
ncbi:MAG: GtrA family protein [Acidimicrobiales bacterium]